MTKMILRPNAMQVKGQRGRPVLLALLISALLSGCSLIPAMPESPLPVSPAWPNGVAPAVGTNVDGKVDVGQIPWQDFFADDRLKKLIQVAIDNNRDLRVSMLNIEKARATYGVSRANLFPSVNATADESAVHTPAGLSSTGSSVTSRQYNVQLGFTSYELDFFGKLRSLKAQALAQYLGTEQAKEDQRITLVAEVATDYLTLIADQRRLQLAQNTLASQQASYDLTLRRQQNGVASGLDVYQAKTSVESARADVAAYTTTVAQDINALTLVLGVTIPEELMPVLPAESTQPIALDSATHASPSPSVAPVFDLSRYFAINQLPVGLPSAVLLKRPDVREAEYALAAANANIGNARAAFFPSITLTAAAGTSSSALSGLFKAGSGAWSFAPSLNLPIFNAGLNRANLDIANTERDITLAQYEKAIQNAFKEVADALAQFENISSQQQAQMAQVDAASHSYVIYDARYKTGVDTYLNALLAQRTLYTAQQSLITVDLARQTNLVTLYKVLGGG